MARLQTLCARSRVWLTNEKGAVALAGGVEGAPPDFEPRIQAALRDLDISTLRALTAES